MISVIVPVYKVEAYLDDCVNSILRQTYTDFELILVDDGSPDRCGAMCDAYAAKDSRVRVIHQPNGGLSAARNAGMEIMQGEYVSFIDSDDVVSPSYLAELYSILINHSADISCCRLLSFAESLPSVVDANETPVVCTSGAEFVREVYKGTSIASVNACGKLFRQAIWAKLMFPNGRLHEDQAVIPLACYRAQQIACTAVPYYYYRARSTSITQSRFTLQRYDDIWAVDQCIRFFEEHGETAIVEAAKRKRQRLICSYAIYARHDGVKVPEEYRVGTIKALRYLRRNASESKYEYCLGLVDQRLVRWYEYGRKIRKILTEKR